MVTEIIITHASCTVKGKNQQTTFRNIFFSVLFDKTAFGISCKLSPKEKETVCMQCQTCFLKKISSNCCLLNLPLTFSNVRIFMIRLKNKHPVCCLNNNARINALPQSGMGWQNYPGELDNFEKYMSHSSTLS